jgi:hypothetical protein
MGSIRYFWVFVIPKMKKTQSRALDDIAHLTLQQHEGLASLKKQKKKKKKKKKKKQGRPPCGNRLRRRQGGSAAGNCRGVRIYLCYK